MAILTCNDLVIGYHSKILSQPINFQVQAGDYLCILGENGMGKSTLLKTCLGLIPQISGNVILGEDLQRSDIGYLPQQSSLQKDFPASCREIVLSGCLNRHSPWPFYTKEEKNRADKTIEQMGIPHLAKQSYRELSGGQQQRVLLARALCAAGKLLFMDEPVTGLDPKVTEEMYHMIDVLNKEGMTIIMISHDLSAALTYATHILYLREDLPFFGTTEVYREHFSMKGEVR